MAFTDHVAVLQPAAHSLGSPGIASDSVDDAMIH
jgi:hypothetical protein